MGDEGPAGGLGTTRTGFGAQPMSTRKSAPSYGFGAASRSTAQKVFVSQEHTALATAGMHSPGPAVYLLPPSVGGKQPDGRRADPPSWGFGTNNRARALSSVERAVQYVYPLETPSPRVPPLQRALVG